MTQQKSNPLKAAQPNDIPVKIIKKNKDLSAFYIHHHFDNFLTTSLFPNALKYAPGPVFEKNGKIDKENYRTVIISPTPVNYMPD